MNLIELTNVPILEQLQLEEALLRADDQNYCIINRGSPPAIVMGISGKPDELLNIPQVQKQNIPIIKRYTGGGTVVVDENTLFVSFIGNHSLLHTPCYPEPLMRWSSQFYPKLTLRENDYVLGNKKCGGNAQYIQKNRWVHHTTFLWDYDPELMQCLLLPSRTPPYRQNRSHNDFLTPLKDHFDTPKHFLENTLSNQLITKTLEPSTLQPILNLPHRRSTHLLYV